MILLSNYDEYIVELKLIEALRNFPLFLSKRLRDMLSEIDHNIARDLLSKHSDLDTRVKQTFIDIHENKADAISFIQSNKAAQLLGLEIDNDDELLDVLAISDIDLEKLQDGSVVYNQYRGETRWGRFINSSFPSKYVINKGGGQNKEDIESFVNLYKALYNRVENFKTLDIVSGDDIAKWYHCDRYANTTGTLSESCMKNVDANFFKLYTSNPDVVNMIIMYANKSKTKIKARALLWKLSTPTGDRKFMDRIYTNDYSDEQTFIDFAKKNNWIYKSRQSMGSEIETVDPENLDDVRQRTLMAEVKPIDYNRYPYMDTLTYYNTHTGKISCKKRYNAEYDLTDTSGGFYELDSYNYEPEYITSRYHNDEIDKNEAIYCIFGDDWVEEDVAIRVYNSSEWGSDENYAVPGNPEVVQSKFEKPNGHIYNRHFPKNKCIWSDHLNTWLFNMGSTSGAKKVWTDIERSNFIIEHTKRNNMFKEINGEYWSVNMLNNGEFVVAPEPKPTRPVGKPTQGWHRKLEFVDEAGNIFSKGKFLKKQ